MSGRTAREYPMALVVTVAGLLLVVLVDELVSGSRSVPVLSFTTGYVAACVALFGLRTWWLTVPAAAILVAACVSRFDRPLMALVCAAATLVVGVAMGELIRRWRLWLTRPWDPATLVVLAVGAGLTLATAQQLSGELAVVGAGSFVPTWIATTTGCLIILPPVLAWRGGSPRQHLPELAALALFAMAVSALVWLYGQSLFQRADIGVSAWLVMPVLLFLGWRYGLFASALALSGLGALTVLVLVSGPPPTIGDLVQRQAVGALLMTVSLTTVILWERQGHALALVQAQERAQQEQAALLGAMFARSPVPTLRTAGTDLQVGAVNEAAARLLGRSIDEVVTLPFSALIAADDRQAVDDMLSRTTADSRWNPQAEVRVHSGADSDRRVLLTATALEGADEYLLHLEDITARRAAEEAVAWHSVFDSGTGLLNRTALGDRLDAALHRVHNDGTGVALIVLDVDDFKSVNDAHGHGAGDTILKEFAARLQNVCAGGDSVARLGADEFAVVVGWSAQETVAVLVGRLQGALSAPVLVGRDTVTLTTSFGVAVAHETDISSGELVRQAELALYRAKHGGRGRVEFYAESMRAQAQAVLNVRNELAHAVLHDAFAVAYQPIVELADGAVVGYEALVRLPTRDGELLTPDHFLEVARSADLLTQVDRLVLRQALRDHAGGRLPVAATGMSVNAESDDLRDPDFAIAVLTQLHARGVEPVALTVEVTEAALLDAHPAVLDNIGSLRQAGVRFAIDDFGTGYSSLSQLRRLNADVIKIDRSFVMGIEDDPESANIVATVIALAQRLDLVCVAEGIETREQAEILRRMGCERGQGYLFGRPTTVATTPEPRRSPERGSGDRSPSPTPRTDPGTG